MRQGLVNHFTWLANKLSEVNTYGWSDEYSRKQVKESFSTFYNSLKKPENQIDLKSLSVAEAVELRFSRWDDESNLWLIPLWFLPLIPVGTELTSINGDKVIFNSPDSIDTDIRYGCLAYGVIIEDKSDEQD